jgi:hypothetical protein
MFQCDQCGKIFKNLGGLNSHKNHCANIQARENKPDPNEVVQCNVCGQHLSRKFLDLHFRTKHNDSQNSPIFVCEFCEKTYRDAGNLKKHVLYYCSSNPNKNVLEIKKINKKKSNSSVSSVWNKGLTKDVDLRIAKCATSLKNYYSTHPGAFAGKKHSEETKALLSVKMTEYNHSNNRRHSHGKHGYFDGVYFMSTWELAYYIFSKENGHEIIRCDKRFKYQWKGKDHYYTPDFIEDGVFVEIKGWETELDKAKYEVVDNLKVVYYNDIKQMIRFVQDLYSVEDISDLYVGD